MLIVRVANGAFIWWQGTLLTNCRYVFIISTEQCLLNRSPFLSLLLHAEKKRQKRTLTEHSPHTASQPQSSKPLPLIELHLSEYASHTPLNMSLADFRPIPRVYPERTKRCGGSGLVTRLSEASSLLVGYVDKVFETYVQGRGILTIMPLHIAL